MGPPGGKKGYFKERKGKDSWIIYLRDSLMNMRVG